MKRLRTSYEIKKLSLLLTCRISSQKLNESLSQCYFEITESTSSVRNLARSYLQVPMEEIIGRREKSS